MWANTACLAWNSHAIHGTPETESLPSYLMTNFNPYIPVECRQSDINCLKAAGAVVVMFARMQTVIPGFQETESLRSYLIPNTYLKSTPGLITSL